MGNEVRRYQHQISATNERPEVSSSQFTDPKQRRSPDHEQVHSRTTKRSRHGREACNLLTSKYT